MRLHEAKRWRLVCRYCFDTAETWVECSAQNTATYSSLQSYMANFTDNSTILVRTLQTRPARLLCLCVSLCTSEKRCLRGQPSLQQQANLRAYLQQFASSGV